MAEKKCIKCGVTKPLSSFSSGRSKCKPCRSSDAKDWYFKNQNRIDVEKRRATSLAWQVKNRALLSARARDRYKTRRAAIIAATRAWQKRNPHMMAANSARRRAMQLKATPPWADKKKISQIYEKAKSLGMDVDHIVPLRSKLVCGLHCESNLQILDRTENKVKNNRYWPDMP